MSRTNGGAPAFPTQPGVEPRMVRGLSKREWFAAMAMQGILAGWDEAPAGEIARASVDMADSLLTALEVSS